MVQVVSFRKGIFLCYRCFLATSAEAGVCQARAATRSQVFSSVLRASLTSRDGPCLTGGGWVRGELLLARSWLPRARAAGHLEPSRITHVCTCFEDGLLSTSGWVWRYAGGVVPFAVTRQCHHHLARMLPLRAACVCPRVFAE